jgi:integrase
VEARPDDFLMCVVKPIPRAGVRRFPKKPMSSTALHRWWYRCVGEAGIVPKGETAGAHMHAARHTAGQRILDATGDLKLVQQFLGHASIQTTGDIYVDYEADQIASKIAEALKRSARDDNADA